MADEVNVEEHNVIQEALFQLPLLNAQLETEQPFGRGTLRLADLDLTHLVDLRRSHETQYAKKGLRTLQRKDLPSMDDEKSAQRELLREFHRSLKDVRVGTGLERGARWKTVPSGNALNAKVVASAAATVVCVPNLSWKQFYTHT